MPGPDETQLHLGAYGLCRDGHGRLLLARMATGPDAGRWTLPGGGVEPGEHPDAAVVRELEEETGAVDVTLGPVVAVYSKVYERPWARVHHVGLLYRIDRFECDLRFEVDGSTDQCEWFSEAEAGAADLVPLAAFGCQVAWP